MNFSAADLRAAYTFLKTVAFRKDKRLPAASNVDFVAKPLKAHGYHGVTDGKHCIWIDTTDTKSFDHMLRIMAHEMCHAILEQHYKLCGEPHDAQFKELARVIELDMGWPKGCI